MRQLVLTGRLVNKHRRLVGDVAGARKRRLLRRPYQAIGEKEDSLIIPPFGIPCVCRRIGRQNGVFKIQAAFISISPSARAVWRIVADNGAVLYGAGGAVGAGIASIDCTAIC